jgi:hypothetical protein
VGKSTGQTAAEAARDGESQESGGGEGEPPALPKGRKFALAFGKEKRGGWSLASFASLANYKADPELVNQLRRVLIRLIGYGQEDAGPRWDWDKFCVRYFTKRSVYPARREEDIKRPALLIMVDSSGSCRGFTDCSFPVAKAVGKLGVPGCSVVVVNHSNGYPHECEVDGKKVVVIQNCNDGDVEESIFAWLKDTLFRKYSLRIVINLGDLDSEWLLIRLASLSSVQKLVLLDNYRCNYLDGPTPAVGKNKPYDFPPTALERKTRWFVGCYGVYDLIKGLEMALR